MPQIYSIFKSYDLFKSDLNCEEYDLIFRCRYDSVFIHPLNLFPLKSILKSNNLYNINFGRAYYPQRVYDIFFGGSKKSMSFISSIWDDLPNLIDNSFNNNQSTPIPKKNKGTSIVKGDSCVSLISIFLLLYEPWNVLKNSLQE